MPASNVQMRHVDTCAACFLTDHHNRPGELLIGWPVNGATTHAEIREGLIWELQRADDLPDAVTDDAMVAAVRDTFANVADDGAAFDPSLDTPSEDDAEAAPDGEPCQAWFLVTWDGAEEGEEEEDEAPELPPATARETIAARLRRTMASNDYSHYSDARAAAHRAMCAAMLAHYEAWEHAYPRESHLLPEFHREQFLATFRPLQDARAAFEMVA